MAEIATSPGTLETPKDAGKGPAGVASRWLMELELSAKTEENWRKNAQDVIDRVRDEKKRSGNKVRYNIVASNVATLEPALYAQSPRPDIRPRWPDQDPISTQVAKVLERSISFHLDAYDFDSAMQGAVHDTLVPGRAVTRVVYKPTMKTVTPGPVPVMQHPDAGTMHRIDTGAPVDQYDTADDGSMSVTDEPYEAKAYEETCCEVVQWDDFRRGPGRTWPEVPWVAFRHKMTKDELVEKFGAEKAENIALDYEPEALKDRKDDKSGVDATVFKRAIVWEVWHKPKREVLWIAPSYADGPAKTEDDPLDLEQFFPIPRPMYSRDDPNSLVPVTDFQFYRDLADELDTITRRISIITAGMKFRGMYDAQIKGLKDLMVGEDNDFLPAENVTAIVQNGGLEKALYFLPIERCVPVLEQLYRQRVEVKQEIFEVSGIADIMRGSTNANETLGAQKIKAQWGTQRLQKRQREVQRYARDIIRIMAEIISEKYDAMTLKLMTGLEVTPEMQQVMRMDGPRAFRIDIETDSTIAADTEAEQANLAELTQGLGALMQAFGPIVESGAMPMEAVKSIVMSLTRKFKLGREVEDALDKAAQQPQQQQTNPQEQQAQAEAQKHGMEMQALQAETQARIQKSQADAQAVQLKSQQDAAEHDAKMQQLALDAEFSQAQHAMALGELEMKRRQAELKLAHAEEMARAA